MEPMIRLNNIEKFYEAGYGKTFVLRRITLDIQEGELLSYTNHRLWDEFFVAILAMHFKFRCVSAICGHEVVIMS